MVEGIEYLGYLSEEDKYKEYASCYCFVFPSRAEGFGIPIVEAMHYDKPIICSDLKAVKEVVGDSIEYFDVSNEETNREKLADVMLRGDILMDKNIYNIIIEKYRPTTVARAYNDFLCEVMDESKT